MELCTLIKSAFLQQSVVSIASCNFLSLISTFYELLQFHGTRVIFRNSGAGPIFRTGNFGWDTGRTQNCWRNEISLKINWYVWSWRNIIVKFVRNYKILYKIVCIPQPHLLQQLPFVSLNWVGLHLRVWMEFYLVACREVGRKRKKTVACM